MELFATLMYVSYYSLIYYHLDFKLCEFSH